MMMKIQNPGRAMARIVVAIGLLLAMIDAAAGTKSTVRRRRRRTTATVPIDAWVRGEPVALEAQTKQQLPSSLLRVEETTTTATIEKIAAAAEMVHDEEDQYVQRMLHSHSLSMSMRMLRSNVDTEDQKQDDVAADRTEESEQSLGRMLQTTSMSMSMSMNMNLSSIFPPIDV